MNKIKRFPFITLIFAIIILTAGCAGKSSGENYPFFGKYIAQDVVYSMTAMQGSANSSYEISDEKFVIYSADKTTSVEIENPGYTEKTVEGNSIKIEYDEIDIAKYTSKKAYDISDPKDKSSNYRIYTMDDEIWFAAYDYNDVREQEEIMYIYSLKKAEK